MKKLTSLSAVLTLALASFLVISGKTPDNGNAGKKNEMEGTGDHPVSDAMQFLNSLRVDPLTGAIDPVLYYQARFDAKQMMNDNSRSFTSMTWEEMGPDNIGGRCRAILIDRNNHNRMYAGGVSGGLFISIDAGNSWQRWSGSDQLETLNISCMAQGSDGAIYFGTGETFGAFEGPNVNGATGFPGEGIFKSTDNGVTFAQLPVIIPANHNLFNTGYAFINSIAVDPTDANKVYAATNGGLKVSADGGQTWASAPGLSASASYDVEITSNGTVHAIIGTKYWRKRTSDAAFIQGTTATAPGFPQTGSSRINLAVSPSNPNYVYAIGSKSDQLLSGVWKSSDGGDSFSQIAGGSVANGSWMPVTQGGYALAIGVHPTNPDMVIIGGIDCYKYTTADGWTKVSFWVFPPIWSQYVHADIHIFVFDPVAPDKMYVGSDGGISATANISLTVPTFSTKNKGFNVTQFYACAGIPDEGSVLAGAQDNGNLFRDLTLPFGQNSPLQFNLVKGGDGGDVATSRLNRNCIFAEYVEGTVQRSANKGLSFGNFFDTHIDANGDGAPEDGAAFISPILLWEDPASNTITNFTHKFYLGTNKGLWMTNNALNLSENPVWFKLNKTNSASQVISIAASSSGDEVYYGCLGGQIYRVTGMNSLGFAYQVYNSTPADTLIRFDQDSAGLVTTLIETLTGAVTSIAIDENNPEHLVVTLGGYTTAARVFESTDAATNANPTFNSIQGSLPQMPVYASLIGRDPNNGNATTVIVGTELGVYARQGSTWSAVNNSVFPNVPVLKLRWVRSSPWAGNWIYASTYGRGVFRTSFFDLGLGIQDPAVSLSSDLNIYPNPANDATYINFTLKDASSVITSLYDLNGRMVARKMYDAVSGANQMPLNVDEMASGTYIVTLETSSGIQTKKLVVVK